MAPRWRFSKVSNIILRERLSLVRGLWSVLEFVGGWDVAYLMLGWVCVIVMGELGSQPVSGAEMGW